MYSKKSSFMTLVAFIMLVFAALWLTGCDSSSSSNTTGSIEVTTISVSPSSINVGGTCVVEVQVTDGSNPVANRAVQFTADPTSAGTFNPAMAVSDANGLVATTFTSSQTGNVTITARISDAIYRTASLTVQASQQTGSGNINLAVTPSLLLADGSSTAELTVTIEDALGNPAPAGTTVRLAAGEKFVDVDANGYFTAGVDSVVYDVINNGSWNPIGIIPSTATVAGTQGQTTVTYIAGTEAVTVYIRATVTEGSYIGYAEIPLQLTPDAAIESIYLMSDSNSLAVQSTGGMETATLTAIGYDANGNRVPEGLQIAFIITDGPGGGERLGTEDYGPYIATTNALGEAYCPVSSGTISGTIRIRAYVGSILSNSTLLMVHAGPPANIVVGADVCNIQAVGWVNLNVDIVAIVSDVYHNPVRDSTAVYFTVDEGTIMAHMNRTVDQSGIAETKWLSGYDLASGDGIVAVIAETAGGTVADTGYFINSWYPDTMWYVEPFPSSIMADGKMYRKFLLEVRDLNGNYVLDQTEIDIESYYVTVASGVVQDGCNGSVVSSFLTSVILDNDYSWDLSDTEDDGIGAIDEIIANYKGFVSVIHPCTLWTGPAYSGGSSIDMNASATYSTQVPFFVTISDRWGNPLGGHRLIASVIGRGTISNGVQYTNGYGEATGFIYNAPAVDPAIEDEKVIIQVVDTDARGNITITKQVSLQE